MLRPPTDNLSIKLLDPSIDESMVRTALAHPNLQLLKDGNSRTVFKSFLPDNSPVIVKTRRTIGFAARLRRLLHETPLQIELRGLKKLHALDIAASTALAYIQASDRESILLRYLPGPTLLEILARPKLTIAQEKALCRAVATQVATLYFAPLHNRDNKPSNLIVQGDLSDPRIAIIDAAGIRDALSLSDSLRDIFSSLWIEPSGTGCTIRRSLAMRFLYTFLARLGASSPTARREARDFWRIVRNHIEYHGDPTPRHDPMIIPPRETDK